MKGKGIFRAFPILLILVIISTGVVLFYRGAEKEYQVMISHESGIYEEDFYLEIESQHSCNIYYTMDGSTPEPGSDSTLVYEAPVFIQIAEETKIYSLRFLCVFPKGTYSFSREFVMEKQGMERYQTTYLVSVTGDEDALWGYENGIFARGKVFDEYLEANPEVDVNSVVIPANYFSNTEVPVHVSVFTADGEEIISKECGLKIYGNMTRAKNQKSFRLYARDCYDGENQFRYPLFADFVSEYTNMVMDEFQRISLHNAGNDNGYAFVRNTLISNLARQSGLQDTLASEGAVVYVNGRYQGFYWLQSTYDDKYFKEKYGPYNGEFVVCEGALTKLVADAETNALEQVCIEEYNTFCEWIKTADLELEENWSRVCETIDIENFARYMALEYYIGNYDWPQNNVKLYRYVASGQENLESRVFDGRYRYLLYDVDYGMGLLFDGWYGYGVDAKILTELYGKDGDAGLFFCLMQKEEFKNLFVNVVLILSQGAFAAENVETELQKLAAVKDAEIHFMFEQTELLKGSIWEGDENSFKSVEVEYEEILDYARRRPELVRKEMQQVLKCGRSISLSIKAPSQCCIQINGMDVGEQYEGYCFTDVPMTISCEVAAGRNVLGYDVNGNYVEGEILLLNADWWCSKSIHIEPILDEFEEECLRILAFHTDGKDDYIILENTGNVEILLSDYYIADSKDASRGKLPSIVLQPGERFYVYGKQYSGAVWEKGYRVSFSWSEDEEIILFNSSQEIVDQR